MRFALLDYQVGDGLEVSDVFLNVEILLFGFAASAVLLLREFAPTCSDDVALYASTQLFRNFRQETNSGMTG